MHPKVPFIVHLFYFFSLYPERESEKEKDNKTLSYIGGQFAIQID